MTATRLNRLALRVTCLASHPTLLETLGLALASPEEPSDVRLLVPRFPEALFRASGDWTGHTQVRCSSRLPHANQQRMIAPSEIDR
jgi:hypothetical protein